MDRPRLPLTSTHAHTPPPAAGAPAVQPEAVEGPVEWQVHLANPEDPFTAQLLLRTTTHGLAAPLTPATLPALLAALADIDHRQRAIVGTPPTTPPSPAASAGSTPSATAHVTDGVDHDRAADSASDADDALDAAQHAPAPWWVRRKLAAVIVAFLAVIVGWEVLAGLLRIG